MLTFVLVDSQRWRQIGLKLVGNTMKFTEQGEISVHLSSEGESMVLSIRDTGCGIPESDLETVRQLFHQVHGNAQRRAGGSGIGLTIVEGFVDLMDGSLQIGRERCLEAGMNDYISKPIAEDALQQMLDKWLIRRNSKSLFASAA